MKQAHSKWLINSNELRIALVRSLSLTGKWMLLPASTNEYDLELCHFDVDQAFVRADLKEDVFMRLPEGCGELSGKIAKLIKILYGLGEVLRQ